MAMIPGNIGTISQFPDGLINYTGGANFGADSNTTLVNDDKDIQIVNLSTSRTYTLPTTGVLAGREFMFFNRASAASTNTLILNASNGSALTIANGCNLDATIQYGRVRVRALQNTPTTPAHWLVIEVEETYQGTITIQASGPFTTTKTASFYLTRIFNTTNLTCALFTATAQQNGAIITSDAFIPTRFRPNTDFEVAITARDDVGGGSNNFVGKAAMISNGTFQVSKDYNGTSNFSNTFTVGYRGWTTSFRNT